MNELVWAVYPVAQLRTSGFGVSEVLPRPTRATVAAERELVEAERALTAAQDQFTGVVFPAMKARFDDLRRAERNLVIHASRAVRNGRPLPGLVVDLLSANGFGSWVAEWSSAVDALREANTSLVAAHEAGFADIVEQVRSALGRLRVTQAISQSAPGFTARLTRDGGVLARTGPLRSKDRSDLMTAHRFLRRLGTRCETVSFYGPSLFVRFDPRSSDPLSTSPGRERVSVDASAWLVRELSRRARRLMPASRVIGRDPLWREDADHLVRVIDGRNLPLTAIRADIWDVLGTGALSGVELARRCACDDSRLRAELSTLAPALRFGPEVPATERHALKWLVDRMPDALAKSLHALFVEAETIRWPARTALFAEAGEVLAAESMPTARAEGQQYADRSFWHEERSSPYSERTVFGAPVTSGVDGVLRSVLPLLYLTAVLERADARTAVRKALAGGTTNLVAAAKLSIDESTPRADALRVSLAEVVRSAAKDGTVAHINAADIHAVCEPMWSTLTDDDLDPGVALPGFDLLADGLRLDRATWVVGEVHDDSSSVLGGSSSRVHSDPDRLFADFCAAVAEWVPVESMATIVSRRRTMHITPELPGLSIELAGVSSKPANDVVPIAEAKVHADGSAVWIRDRRYWLYPGDLSSALHRAVSLPCLRTFALPDSSPVRPRVVVDGVVLTRENWTVTLPAAPDPWRWAQRLRRDLGWPDRVFVRPAGEPKPVFVDLDDPVAVADLARFGPAKAVVTECLPDMDRLWWQVDGRRQVAELRFACLVRHGDRP